jgi:hypothetical protein
MQKVTVRCPPVPKHTMKIRRGADKCLAFPIPYFLYTAQPKEFFLDELKKLDQRSHKCVGLKGEYSE